MKIGLPYEGRPLLALTFVANSLLAGLETPFHLTNYALHAGTASMLFVVAHRTFRSPLLRERYGARAASLAFCAALVFAAHPLNSMVACYLSARSESLLAILSLATIYFAIRSSDSQNGITGAVLCCAFGITAKESMAEAPLVVVLYLSTLYDSPEAWRQPAPERAGDHEGLGRAACAAAPWLSAHRDPRPTRIGPAR